MRSTGQRAWTVIRRTLSTSAYRFPSGDAAGDSDDRPDGPSRHLQPLRSEPVTDVVDLLDRQRDHLRGLDRVDFLRRLPHLVELLRGQPELRELLDEFEAEARQAQERFAEREDGLIERAVAVRRRLTELAPAADDSGADEPDDWGGRAHSDWQFSLAHFDRLAVQNFSIVYPKIPRDGVEQGPLGELVNILRGKLHEQQYGEDPHLVGDRENARPDLDELVVELSNVLEEDRHAVQAFVQASRTLPGAALARIEHFASNLNPAPALIDPNESQEDRFHKLLLGAWSRELPVQQAVAGQHLDDYTDRRLDATVEDLRSQIELLHTSLVEALSTEELRRARQWWRKLGRWFSVKVGEALVAIIVTAIIGLAAGFLGGYLFGQRAAEDPAQPPTTTATTTSTAP